MTTSNDISDETSTAAHIDINEELKQRALKNIQTALHGNGIKPENVEISTYQPEAIEFLAATTLTPDAKISVKRQPGKGTGAKLVDNAAMFPQEMAKEVTKITRSPDVINRIKEEIFKRPDKGLAIKDEYLTMPFLHRDFVAHEPCQPCRAQGKIPCGNCGGKGAEPCPTCHARGSQTCPTCSGRQYLQGPNGQNQHCQRCRGTGRITCMRCHEARTVQCRQCAATGSIKCHQCNGHATISAIATAAINMIGNYDYDKSNLQDKTIRVLEHLGEQIQYHTFIGANDRPKDTEKQTTTIDILLHIKAPTANIEFEIKGKTKTLMTIPAYMFGRLGAVYETPPFLEKILTPGIKSLRLAAQGQGDVAAHIRKSGRYRTLRQIIMMTAKTNPRAALGGILEKNPIGLSEENTKKLIVMAQQALKHIGKRPRQIGYVLGILTATGLLALYYQFLQGMLPTNMPPIVIHSIALICAATAGYILSDIYAKTSIQKTLKNLFSRQ